MVFKPDCVKQMHTPSMTLNGKTLEYVDIYKYLGVYIDLKLCDKTDISRHIKSTYSRGNHFIKRFRHCSTPVKNYLFRTFFSSMYGCQLWAKYTLSDFKKAIVSYNDVYRNLFGIRRGESISSYFVNHNVDSFKVLLRKAVFSFNVRLFRTSNLLVQNAINCDMFTTTRLAGRWHDLLYL